jgi:hypothetical protein
MDSPYSLVGSAGGVSQPKVCTFQHPPFQSAAAWETSFLATPSRERCCSAARWFLFNVTARLAQPNTERSPLRSSSELASGKLDSELQLFRTAHGFNQSDMLSGNAVQEPICSRRSVAFFEVPLQVLPNAISRSYRAYSIGIFDGTLNLPTPPAGHVHFRCNTLRKWHKQGDFWISDPIGTLVAHAQQVSIPPRYL